MCVDVWKRKAAPKRSFGEANRKNVWRGEAERERELEKGNRRKRGEVAWFPCARFKFTLGHIYPQVRWSSPALAGCSWHR